MLMRAMVVVTAIVLANIFLAEVAQGAPAQLPYVGRLSYATGAPFSGPADIGASLHHSAVGNTEFWSHTYAGKGVVDGVISLTLGGDGSPILDTAQFAAPEVWLQLSVNGTPLSPRQRVLSVPYALIAQNADQLAGLAGSDYALSADLQGIGNQLAQLSAQVAQLQQSSGGGTGGAGLSWQEASNSTAATAGTGYVATSNGARVEFSLPSTCALGDIVRVVGRGTAGFRVVLPNGGAIWIDGEQILTAAGSQHATGSLELVCIHPSSIWNATSHQMVGQECDVPRESCAAHLAAGCTSDGQYQVDPDGTSATFAPAAVWCDMTRDGGGWTMVMRSGTAGPSGTWSTRAAVNAPAAPAPSGSLTWKFSDAYINAVRGATGVYRVSSDTFGSNLYFKSGEYDHTRSDLPHLYQAWTNPQFSGNACSAYYSVHFGLNSWTCSYYIIANYIGQPYGGPWNAWVK